MLFNMDSKACTTCKIEKPLSEYSRNKKHKDGHNYICKSCFADYQREYHKKNYDILKKKRDKYRSDPEVKKRNTETCRKYQKQRRYSDPLFRARVNIRNRTKEAFAVSFWTKTSRTRDILGCDYKTAFKHIEEQFRDGMSWDNYGEWHIDHIIPLCSATTVQELEKLCHYTNLQPLWAEENLFKGGKMPEDLF